jgi:hypothetical protein
MTALLWPTKAIVKEKYILLGLFCQYVCMYLTLKVAQGYDKGFGASAIVSFVSSLI